MRIFCAFTLFLLFSSQVTCGRFSSKFSHNNNNYYVQQSLHLKDFSDSSSRHSCITDIRLKGQNQIPQCSIPVEEISSGQLQPGIKFRRNITPKWMNLTLYMKGQEFAKKNLQIVFFTNFMASLFLAGEKDAADILAFTDSNILNVGTPRFLLTMKLLLILFNNDLSSITGNAVIFKIRRILDQVANRADEKLAKGCSLISYNKFTNASVDNVLWRAVEADLQMSNILEENRKYSEKYILHRENASPVNQFLLANIQFLFVGLPFVAPDIQGMTNPTNEELNGWNHMWAVLGHAIGIEDAFNVALQPTLSDAKIFYTQFYKTYVIPNIFYLTKESKILMEMLLNAGQKLPPNDFLGSDLLLVILLEDFMGIKAPKTRELLPKTSLERLGWWQNRKSFMTFFPRTSTYLKMMINNDFQSKFHRQWRNWFGTQYMSDTHIAMYTSA